MIYQGSCHCGRIAFEIEGDLEQRIVTWPPVPTWICARSANRYKQLP